MSTQIKRPWGYWPMRFCLWLAHKVGWLFPVLLLTAAVPSPQNIILAWDTYPAAELTPDLTFKLYTSTDISVPLANWTVIRTVPGTNTQVTISVIPGRQFFYLTASNFWGESDPSGVLGLPPAPRQGVLTVRKGQ